MLGQGCVPLCSAVLLCCAVMYCPLQVLPHHLGGTSELIPVEAAWKQLLLQRQQQQLAAAEPATASVSSTDCCQDVSREGFQGLSGRDQAADAAVLIHTA